MWPEKYKENRHHQISITWRVYKKMAFTIDIIIASHLSRGDIGDNIRQWRKYGGFMMAAAKAATSRPK